MDLNKSGIYKIVNKINSREYYGSAEKFRRRKIEHFRLLRKNNHGNKYLQNDFNKCGEENFEFKIILYCDIDNLLFYEQRFLDKYCDNCNQCYNICKIAAKPPCSKGRKHSDKTKQKISKAQKGENNAMYGKRHSAKTKNKISEIKKGKHIGENNPNYGKKHSEETKQKIGTHSKKLWRNFDYKEKMCKINKGRIVPQAIKAMREVNIKKEKYSFINEKLNLEEHCTKYELYTKYNLDDSSLTKIIKNKKRSVKGWKIKL